MQTIILVGSSIFQGWKNAINLIPSCTISNRAISGTITSYWVEHLATVLNDESPDIVMYYAGSNDVSGDITPETILANILKCREIIYEHSPSIKLVYFGIIKAPQKIGKWDVIDSLNDNIASILQADDLFIDPNAVFFCDDTPVAKFYIEDGLHLTDEAYDQLSTYTAPIIEKWIKDDSK